MAYSVRFFYGLKMFVSLNVILFCKQGQKFASSNLTLVSSNWTLEEGVWSIPVTRSPIISSLKTIGYELTEIRIGESQTHQSLFLSDGFSRRFQFGLSPFRLPPDKTSANFGSLDLKTLFELGAEILTTWKANLAQWSVKVWEPHEVISDHAETFQIANNMIKLSKFFKNDRNSIR